MAAETLWSYAKANDLGVNQIDQAPDRNSGTTQWTRNIFEGQALGLLVPVG